jgi:hypothetical protein
MQKTSSLKARVSDDSRAITFDNTGGDGVIAATYERDTPWKPNIHPPDDSYRLASNGPMSAYTGQN